ncbi:MAG: hypothetical protein ACOY0T_13910 [Myxococcota bacterium]
MDPANFDKLSRDELVAKARSLGVERPELMTRVELGDEIVRRTQTDPSAQQRARGWLGVARDLVASVVGSGLSMPDAAALIRGERSVLEFKGPPPVATVTLAEIYAAQGHVDRALSMLDEVLAREPEHAAALALRERLSAEPRGRRVEPAPRVAESEAPAAPEASAVREVFAPGEPEPSVASEAPAGVQLEAEMLAQARAVTEAVADAVLQADSEADAEPDTAHEPTPLPVAEPAFIEPPPSAVRPEHESAAAPFDASSIDSEGSVFEPVPLAPPLTELPTRPDAASLDAAPSPPSSPEPPPMLEGSAPLELSPEAEAPPVVEPPFLEPRAVETPPEREPQAPPAIEAPAELPEAEPLPILEMPAAATTSFEPESLVPRDKSEPASEIVPTLLPPPMPGAAQEEAALVIVRRDGDEPLVCWELPEFEAGYGEPFELECHAFFVTTQGPQRKTVTLVVEARRGSASLPSFSAAILIRAALGRRAGEAFHPLLIASELSLSGGTLEVRFRPPLTEGVPPTAGERSLVEQFAI